MSISPVWMVDLKRTGISGFLLVKRAGFSITAMEEAFTVRLQKMLPAGLTSVLYCRMDVSINAAYSVGNPQALSKKACALAGEEFPESL